MKYVFRICIVIALAFGLYAVQTGDLTWQPMMYLFFGIAYLEFSFSAYKKGQKGQALLASIPFILGVIIGLVFLSRI